MKTFASHPLHVTIFSGLSLALMTLEHYHYLLRGQAPNQRTGPLAPRPITRQPYLFMAEQEQEQTEASVTFDTF